MSGELNTNVKLTDLVDNTRTDKHTTHSYLDLYQHLFESKKTSAKNVLEVGIYAGGSIALWHDYFTNATVYGLDIMPRNQVWREICDVKRIVLHTSNDAYDETMFKTNFLDKNLKFDVMLDDGPHTLESMIQFIKLYHQLMTDDGILIIEDIQSWDWLQTLIQTVPEDLRQYIKIYDLRQNKGRYDDIVFSIDKSSINTNGSGSS
jgi:cephalosporin hydroxylase